MRRTGIPAVTIVRMDCCRPGARPRRKGSVKLRQPVNVHVFLYRKNAAGDYEYAMLQRSDNPLYWQGVAGGVEEGETIEQAARREAHEEAGTPPGLTLYPLESVSYLPATLFEEQEEWGKDVVVTPMFYFGAPYDGEITISEEHAACRWCTFDEAEKLVYWHDQQKALWELNERLMRGNLVRR